MITTEVYRTLRNSICAIAASKYSNVWDADFDQNVDPEWKVFGTGFLLENDVVLTNKHIFNEIRNFTWGRVAIVFIHNVTDSKVARSYHPIKGAADVNNFPAHFLRDDDEANEIAFLKVAFDNAQIPRSVHPVTLGSPSDIQIGNSIGVCGFIHGEELLNLSDKLVRFEPLLLQGHIAGICPFDGDPSIIITDITNGPGLSGSPVFTESGKVIGLHFGGIMKKITRKNLIIEEQQTHRLAVGIGFAIPLTGQVFQSGINIVRDAFENMENNK